MHKTYKKGTDESVPFTMPSIHFEQIHDEYLGWG